MKNELRGDFLTINAGHDSSVTFLDRNDQVRIYEFERFCKRRYAGIWEVSHPSSEEYRNKVTNEVREFFQLIKSELKQYPQTIGFSEVKGLTFDLLQEIFPNCNYYEMGHHMSHCAGAYYQSGFKRALAISIDGGGMDYNSDGLMYYRSHSVYTFEGSTYDVIAHTNDGNGDVWNPGIYGQMAYYISEIKNQVNLEGRTEMNALAYAGKIMGLAAYGKVRDEWVEPLRRFYKHHPSVFWANYGEETYWIDKELYEGIGIELTENCLSGQDSYDLAATNQYVFEEICFSLIKKYVEEYNMDLIFSGGSALNVLFNQKLAEYLDEKNLKLYIPPYPGDDGISFGHYINFHSFSHDPSPYCGMDILDREKIDFYHEYYSKKGKVFEYTVSDIVDLIKDGKIGGIIQGYSEVGPRALGNRSIICDPSISDMKDILNAKVKFREWFRPFAPVCREEDRNVYFKNAYPSEYMSFAPEVKEEYRKVLPAITHADGTARLQTVNSSQHKLFYDILTELRKRNHISVIMNTSFNIRGNPILTTYEDAFYVLENTEMDFIVTEKYLFIK